jgi:hypothetical protein
VFVFAFAFAFAFGGSFGFGLGLGFGCGCRFGPALPVLSLSGGGGCSFLLLFLPQLGCGSRFRSTFAGLFSTVEGLFGGFL